MYPEMGPVVGTLVCSAASCAATVAGILQRTSVIRNRNPDFHVKDFIF
jgi:hypothetical protein